MWQLNYGTQETVLLPLLFLDTPVFHPPLAFLNHGTQNNLEKCQNKSPISAHFPHPQLCAVSHQNQTETLELQGSNWHLQQQLGPVQTHVKPRPGLNSILNGDSPFETQFSRGPSLIYICETGPVKPYNLKVTKRVNGFWEKPFSVLYRWMWDKEAQYVEMYMELQNKKKDSKRTACGTNLGHSPVILCKRSSFISLLHLRSL